MPPGSFEVVIARSIHQNYHALLQALELEGYSTSDVEGKFEEIAVSHNIGTPPGGAWPLGYTNQNNPIYGWKVFGRLIKYVVRRNELRIVVDFIQPYLRPE